MPFPTLPHKRTRFQTRPVYSGRSRRWRTITTTTPPPTPIAQVTIVSAPINPDCTGQYWQTEDLGGYAAYTNGTYFVFYDTARLSYVIAADLVPTPPFFIQLAPTTNPTGWYDGWTNGGEGNVEFSWL